MTALEDSIN